MPTFTYVQLADGIHTILARIYDGLRLYEENKLSFFLRIWRYIQLVAQLIKRSNGLRSLFFSYTNFFNNFLIVVHFNLLA